MESDLSNETSLVLGKYLSPRLYMSYGISLTESINTVKMRYTLERSLDGEDRGRQGTQRRSGLYKKRIER